MTNPTKVSKTAKTEDQTAIEVDLADIPLPPPELDDELDNSHLAKGATASTETGGKASKPGPETARLDFVTGAETRVQTHDLEHPFHLDGELSRRGLPMPCIHRCATCSPWTGVKVCCGGVRPIASTQKPLVC